MINYCLGTKCKSHLRKKGVSEGAAHMDTNASPCVGLEGSVHLNRSGASLSFLGIPPRKYHTQRPAHYVHQPRKTATKDRPTQPPQVPEKQATQAAGPPRAGPHSSRQTGSSLVLRETAEK